MLGFGSPLGKAYGAFNDPNFGLERSFHNKYIIGENDFDFECPTERKSLFAPSGHYIINIQGICVNILLPWLLFTGLFYMMIFKIHYTNPWLVWAAIGFGFFLSLCTYLLAKWCEEEREFAEPRWYKYAALAFFLATLCAATVGNYVFWNYSNRFYDYQTLNIYNDVSPATQRGEMLMDSGRVYWKQEARVATEYSMGFMNKEMYCVAPIVKGHEAMKIYDFWVVGKNCCADPPNKFTCDETNNPSARSSIRQMNIDDRPFYHLAVQQAEAAYGINANHPVFFHWVQDPVHYSDAYWLDASRFWLVGSAVYFCINLFCVICAVWAFSKIGRF